MKIFKKFVFVMFVLISVCSSGCTSLWSERRSSSWSQFSNHRGGTTTRSRSEFIQESNGVKTHTIHEYFHEDDCCNSDPMFGLDNQPIAIIRADAVLDINIQSGLSGSDYRNGGHHHVHRGNYYPNSPPSRREVEDLIPR